MRGFVYPRSIDEVRAMKPGEMFALRGLGKLGANFGIGAPILVADPTGGLTYRIVASGGVSTVVAGQIDVQLVRLADDEIVIDVGVENASSVGVQAAIRDGWGVKALCADGLPCLRPVELGGTKVDLSQLLEKAVEQRLNQYLSLKIAASASHTSTRVSLSRIRFHLDRGDADEVSKALEQALKFDVRLAQALYNRDLGDTSAAVSVDFDALRSATTSTRNFGFELLGMNIYHRAVVDKVGTFVVQTPDGVQEVLFDSINKHSGWFQMSHGYSRTGVGAQMIDARTPDTFRGEANLFYQVNVGDTHMDDDMLIDNVDGLLAALVGHDAVEALDKFGNELQRTVWAKCPVQVQDDLNGQTQTWDEACNVQLLDDPIMSDLKAQGMAAIEPFAAQLPDDYAALVRDAANVRLTLQSVGIHNLDAMNGPNASFSLDVRLDDKALSKAAFKGRDAYRSALREYLTAVYADRMKVGAGLDKDGVRKQVDDKWAKQMDTMADVYEKKALAYKLIVEAEQVVPEALAGKHFASFPLGVRFTIDRDASKMYASAIMNSISHDRALAAAGLFDALLDAAGGLHAPLYPEHTAAYSLLALVPTNDLQVGMDVEADVQSTFWVSRDRFLKAGFKTVKAGATGADVTLLGAGMFDLSAVIGAQ
jgi:hypothetical protein